VTRAIEPLLLPFEGQADHSLRSQALALQRKVTRVNWRICAGVPRLRSPSSLPSCWSWAAEPSGSCPRCPFTKMPRRCRQQLAPGPPTGTRVPWRNPGGALDSRAMGRIYSLCANFFAHMRHQPDLTRREAQIMEILHRRRRATVEEIRSELPDAPTPSSVRKLLDIMIDRRLLAREYNGPRFIYFPAAKPEEASKSALRQLVRTFFDDSPGSAAAALLDMAGEPLSDDDYKRLSALIRRGREQGGRK
jgi:BlaI family transcriptional regulator, penicillinase repressor